MEQEIRIEEIDASSPYLTAVRLLWRVNASTLGFFTQGAFEDYASRKQILVALTNDNQFLGYCLYRVSRSTAHIVHLCIGESFRGRGIAGILVRRLREVTKDLKGIRLRCRQDYDANEIWPKLHFVRSGEEIGRSKDGKKLTVWWLSHNHPNLFTDLEAEALAGKLSVALDANVFFDLIDPARPYHEESQALTVDWLSDLELCLTDEINNEISQNKREVDRQKSFAAASQYTRLRCDNDVLDTVSEKLKTVLKPINAKNDAADFRQLARTIAADAKFFVTRDNDLLGRADDIYQAFGVTVIRPADLIVQFDALRREDEYQPVRLMGTLSEVRRVQSKEESQLAACFLCSSQGEAKSDFQKELRLLLASPEKYICNLALDVERNPMALFVYDASEKDTFTVPLLRTSKGRLSNTLLRLLILRAVIESTRTKHVFTAIIDKYLDENAKQALIELGFIVSNNKWVKLNPAVLLSARELAAYLMEMKVPFEGQQEFLTGLTSTLQKSDPATQANLLAEIERLLWPCKISDAEIPSFIIPIRPNWAKDLFDEKLASQTLFGAVQELALNRESVYYKKTRNSGGLQAPGRILWYVSGKGSLEGKKSLRACARIEEVIIGKPNELYRRFKRLGVYTWEHVFNTADRDINKAIMAIRFSDPELLPNPIAHKHLQDILRQHEIKTQLQSPVRISPQVFSELYSLGNNLENQEK
jgi:predicted nucleic acid-binding protein/GNAT superfamily N-acetyltransferase